VSGKNSSVWVARADGSRPRKIARNAFAGALSPSGHWIAYLRGGDHPDRALPHLYLTRIRGGPEEEVARVRWFVWSPKQDRLAYADMKTLRVFDIKTGKSRILVRTPDVRSISFAPSGDALAFARDNGRVDSRSRVDIYSVKIADTRVRRLTNDGHSGEPVWGPTWIAYRHYIRTQWPQTGGTWLMQPDGSEKRPFARGDQDPGHAHYGLRPVEFSRDGTRLLACTDAEFGCSPVTFFVSTTKRHVFSVGEFPRHVHALLVPEDMSGNGRRLLVGSDPWTGHRPPTTSARSRSREARLASLLTARTRQPGAADAVAIPQR
jgi:hypothetical protein